MVLILSEKKDRSTTEVIRWLDYYNQKWLRVNKDDTIGIIYNQDSPMLVINNDQRISFSKITSFWYRRGFLNYKYDLNGIPSQLQPFLKEENFHLNNYFYYLLEEKKGIGKLHTSVANKLVSNELARKLRLKIPSSYVLTSRKELEKVIRKHDTLITKSIAGNGFFNVTDEIYGAMYTTIVEDATDFPENFAPSYFQEYIEKRYELRVFFLKDTFYSMAIFSQNDEQTRVDFRVYNNVKPNRTVPFELPKYIESKLSELMNIMNLDSASIDLIVTDTLEYFFLEVNPIGQFGMVSHPCNYHLEELIAKELI